MRIVFFIFYLSLFGFISCSEPENKDNLPTFQMALLGEFGLQDSKSVEIFVLENDSIFNYLYDSLHIYSKKFIPETPNDFNEFIKGKIEDDIGLINKKPKFVLKVTQPIKIGEIYLMYVHFIEIKSGIAKGVKNEIIGLKMKDKKFIKFYFEPNLKYGL